MKAKNCLIFGGSGQIGRHLIRKLTKNNYKVTVVTRNLHQKGYVIKTQANAYTQYSFKYCDFSRCAPVLLYIEYHARINPICPCCCSIKYDLYSNFRSYARAS